MATNQSTTTVPENVLESNKSLEQFTKEVAKEPNSSFIDNLKNNPMFGAGAGLVGIGAGLSILKKSTSLGYTVMLKNFTVSLDVVSKDKSYAWVLRWINEHLNKRAQHINVDTFFTRNERSQRVSTSFTFTPSIGTHYFKYKNSWIRAERVREQVVDRNTGSPVETLKLQTLGRSTDVFQSILNEARQGALSEQTGKTLIYNAMTGIDWGLSGWPKDKRPFTSVILDQGVAENVKKDCIEFLENSKWYHDRGIPYRRGYLLHGPPGCGKTSFITALAASIEHDIAILNLSDRGLTDDRLSALFSKAPLNCIILLEDIDAAFGSREAQMKQNPGAFQGFSPLTLSGLLNALDGVAESDGRIVFMTTNYADRLDPALIRPGRVDFKQYIGHATEYQAMNMFLKFYPEANPATAQAFAAKLMSLNLQVSSAQIQGYLMLYKNEPILAYENIENFEINLKNSATAVRN